MHIGPSVYTRFCEQYVRLTTCPTLPFVLTVGLHACFVLSAR